jgi:hypothetical protein
MVADERGDALCEIAERVVGRFRRVEVLERALCEPDDPLVHRPVGVVAVRAVGARAVAVELAHAGIVGQPRRR